MDFLSRVNLSCFLLSYLVAFGGEVFQLLRQRSGLTRAVLLFATTAGLVAHTAYLVTRSSTSGLPPLVGSSHDWLLVLAWVVVTLYLIGLASSDRITLGVFLLPVIVGMIALALFVDDVAATEKVREVATHRWGMLHAATLVVGMVCVSAATICAVMYLLQHQKLRGRTSWLHRFELPNLERLTTINRWLVIGTVIMLTIGLLTGFILAFGNSDEPFDWTDPIIGGTTVVWALMVITLVWLLTQKEQTGRQVARMTLLAGGFLLLTVFGLMFLSGGVHGDSSASAPAVPSADAGSLSQSDSLTSARRKGIARRERITRRKPIFSERRSRVSERQLEWGVGLPTLSLSSSIVFE